MVDCHTHILPRMDDGSRSSDESIAMLKMEHEQGVDSVILTPHFYADRESLESFLNRRDASEARLRERITGDAAKSGSAPEALFQQGCSSADADAKAACSHEFPDIHIGAEVRYFQGISRMEGIEGLCIKGTPHMLIEMPFEPWPEGVFRDLEILQSAGIKPVIAHIERYIQFQKRTENLERLWSMDLMIQSNASFFTERRTRRTALKMLKQGRIDLLATDCHRAEGQRVPDMDEALAVIEKKLGREAVEVLERNGRRILE